MREVIRYEADDGSIHATPDLARERDSQLAAISDAMWGLGERPIDDPEFMAGRLYVQHAREAVDRAWDAIQGRLGELGSLRRQSLERLRTIDHESKEWATNLRGRDARPLAPRLKERADA